MKIFDYIFKKKSVFPQEIKDYWLAGDDYEREYQRYKGNKKARKKYLMPYFDKKGSYIKYSVNDIVAMMTKCGQKAFYKIVNISCQSWGSDLAGFDDGKKYTLKFHHTTKRY